MALMPLSEQVPFGVRTVGAPAEKSGHRQRKGVLIHHRGDADFHRGSNTEKVSGTKRMFADRPSPWQKRRRPSRGIDDALDRGAVEPL
jgi:hypothetical protein